MNYLMIISYDGTRYKGWQRLKDDDSSIQLKVENVISRLIDEDIKVIGSGRTDAGVHAMSQFVNFHTDVDLPKSFIEELNKYLPEDVRVISFKKVKEEFHARFSAIDKTYMYLIDNSKYGNPLMRNLSYHVPEKLNIGKMREISRGFIGKHDFTTFTNAKSKKKSMKREIFDIEIISRDDSIIEINIRAEGFLHNMARRMVTVLIEATKEDKDSKYIDKLIKSKDRSALNYQVPSKGLYLKKVTYKD